MKKVFVSGVFNVVHPGHIRLLKYAKSIGDQLIVGIYSDKLISDPNYLSQNLRLENLKTNSLIDKIVLIEHSIITTLKKLKPDYVVKGKEHKFKRNLEKNVLEKFGGELLFSSGDQEFGSFDLIEKNNLFNKNKIALPSDYLKRHNINKNDIISSLKNISKLKVCVIGDVIIDNYIDCKHIGMSQENNSLVVTPIKEKNFFGGAGIVAAHCASLGANVDFFTLVGDDSNSKYIKRMSNKYKLNLYNYFDKTRPTTVKKRYTSENRTLLKVSNLSNRYITQKLEKQIIADFKRKVKKYNLIILSDFNYGLITKELLKNIISIAKQNKCTITADSQSSSQIGDITKFKNIDLITPTEHESRIALKNNNDGLVILAKELLKVARCKYAIIKLGREGVFIQSKLKVNKFITDILPPISSNVIDSSGAGDSMLSGISLFLSLKKNIWNSVLFGSILASVQVERLGNTPIKIEEILSKLDD